MAIRRSCWKVILLPPRMLKSRRPMTRLTNSRRLAREKLLGPTSERILLLEELRGMAEGDRIISPVDAQSKQRDPSFPRVILARPRMFGPKTRRKVEESSRSFSTPIT
jgi:hypothetical protein